jgi:uncharacterized membrane protein
VLHSGVLVRVGDKWGDDLARKVQDTRTIAITAVMAAVVAAFTLFIRVPSPATGGYANLSDVAVFFVAFTFGPVPALVAGGLGAALADILSGAPQFAWLSFLAHGLEGLIAGYVARRAGAGWLAAGWICGAAAMVLGYFSGETLILTGIGPAIEEMPVNIGQVVIGGVVGVALTFAVRQAYPQVAQIGKARSWREI